MVRCKSVRIGMKTLTQVCLACTLLTSSLALPVDQGRGSQGSYPGYPSQSYVPSGQYQYADYDEGDVYRELQNQLALAELETIYSDPAGYYNRPQGAVAMPALEATNWPVDALSAGQISGVAVGPRDDVYVFHRGARVWDKENNLFDENNVFTERDEGPIKEPTLLRLSTAGKVINRSASGRFYLPHGISTDREGNLWLTDVAMHQVFKMAPDSDEPELVLGEAFEPAKNNSDTARFCKPTDVAVASNGDFFVADGYCNSRVVKFNSKGEYVKHFGVGELSVPHSLTLAEELDMVCVADRENKRVACYAAGLLNPEDVGRRLGELTEPSDQRIFAIAYAPEVRLMYGVTEGNDGTDEAGTGFTIDFNDNGQAQTVEEWSPSNQGFKNAHDVAVNGAGDIVYVVTLDPPVLYKFERAQNRQPVYDDQPSEYDLSDEVYQELLQELVLENALYDAMQGVELPDDEKPPHEDLTGKNDENKVIPADGAKEELVDEGIQNKEEEAEKDMTEENKPEADDEEEEIKHLLAKKEEDGTLPKDKRSVKISQRIM